MRIDSVQIGVADRAAALQSYGLLLGVPAVHTQAGAYRFQLSTGAVELEDGEPGLHSLRLTIEAKESAPSPAAFNGLTVHFGATSDRQADPPVTSAGVQAIDHIVVHSPDLDRAIGLWRDRVGLRLALDREFPARGIRILFFRAGGVTLEIGGTIPPPSTTGPDRFFGVTYRVASVDRWRIRLAQAGFDVSEVRAGHKTGTTVATVRSGTAGVPTLLLEDPSRQS